MNILLIEDEVLVLDALKAYLEREQYRVFVATTGNEGLTIFEKEKIDLPKLPNKSISLIVATILIQIFI